MNIYFLIILGVIFVYFLDLIYQWVTTILSEKLWYEHCKAFELVIHDPSYEGFCFLLAKSDLIYWAKVKLLSNLDQKPELERHIYLQRLINLSHKG